MSLSNGQVICSKLLVCQPSAVKDQKRGRSCARKSQASSDFQKPPPLGKNRQRRDVYTKLITQQILKLYLLRFNMNGRLHLMCTTAFLFNWARSLIKPANELNPHLYTFGWIIEPLVKRSYWPWKERKWNQNIGSIVVWGPLHTEKKNWYPERCTDILCYKWNIYHVIMAGEQTLLMNFLSRMIFLTQNCQKRAPIVVNPLLGILPIFQARQGQ